MIRRKTRPVGPMMIGALCALFVLAGCRTYQPKPLDPAAHRAAWHGRTPTDDSVRAFIQRLAEQGDDAAASFDAEDGLTLAEADLVALIYNPDLRLARLEAGVAEASADYAGRWDDPQVQAELLRVTEDVSDPWIVGAGLSITLPISGRLAVEKAQANAERRVALQRVAEAEWQTRYDLRRAWVAWSAAELRAQEQSKLIQSVDGLTRTMAELAKAGEALPTEAALFEIEQLQRAGALVRSRGEATELEQQLRALMGLSPDAELSLIPAMSLPIEQTPPSLDALGERNPTLLRLSEAYDAAEQGLRREVRKQIPDLTIGTAYENEDGQSKIGLTGGIPIPVLNRNRQAIAKAQADRELARAVFETAYEKLVGRFTATTSRANSLRGEEQLLVNQAAPLIDKQLADAQRLLSLGEGSPLVLLESLTRAHDTKLRLIEVRMQAAEADAQLRYLAGPMHQNNNVKSKPPHESPSAPPAQELSR